MSARASAPSARRCHAVLAIVGILLAAAARAADPQAPVAAPVVTVAPRAMASYDTFRLIGDRNIFNPNRVGRTRNSDVPQPRVDTISFVGTMNYEKGLFAFFDGSDANYRKALQEGGTIAQYTVTRIQPNSVELMRDKKPLTLQVADQLRRPDGGDWGVVVGSVVRSEASAAEAAAATDPSVPVITIPSDASDTLKRLMEQRQKQLKQ